MPVNIEMLTPTTIEVDVLGGIEKSDYQRLETHVEQALLRAERFGLVVNLQRFTGVTASALWADLKFDARHFSDVNRLAIVGAANQEWMATVSKPFTSADVQFFGVDGLDRARAWARGDAPAHAGADTGKAEGDILGVSRARGDLPGPRPEPGPRGPKGIEIELERPGTGDVPVRSGHTAIDMGGGGQGHRVAHERRRRARST